MLLPALSKQAGVSLSSSMMVGNEVLLVQVKDVNLSDLMRWVATAVGGAWAKTSSGYQLNRPSESVNAQVKAELEVRVAAVKKALEPYMQALDKQSGTEQVSEGSSAPTQTFALAGTQGGAPVRVFSTSSSGPGVNAITRLIQGLGAGAIAALPADSRTVYATSPTRSQEALPFNAGQIVTALIQELRQNQTPADAAPAQQGSGRRGRPTLSGASGNLDLTPAKADLVVSRLGFGDTLVFQLLIGDSQGRLVARADMVLVPNIVHEGNVDFSLAEGDGALDLPAETVQLAKLMQSGAAGSSRGPGGLTMFIASPDGGSDSSMIVQGDPGKTPDVEKSLKDKITDPEANEPLALCAGAALSAAADTAGLNLVAVLPDSALVPAARTIASGKATAGGVLSAAQTDWGLKAAKDGDCLVLRPRRQAACYDYRLSRPVLGTTLKRLAADGMLSLDDRAAYATGQPLAPMDENFEVAYFRLVNAAEGDRIAAGSASGERKMLRFYGALSFLQKQALGSGKNIAISGFDFAQRRLLSDMVFNSMDGPTIGGQGPGPGQPPQARRPMPAIAGGDLTTERTEVLPDGLPTGGILTVQSSNRPAVFGLGPSGEKVALGGPVRVTFASADGGQNAQLSALSPTQYSLYVQGTQSNYVFLFQLTPTVTFRRTLADYHANPSAQAVPYDQLPDDVKHRLEQTQNLLGRITIGIQQQGNSGPVRP